MITCKMILTWAHASVLLVLHVGTIGLTYGTRVNLVKNGNNLICVQQLLFDCLKLLKMTGLKKPGKEIDNG